MLSNSKVRNYLCIDVTVKNIQRPGSIINMTLADLAAAKKTLGSKNTFVITVIMQVLNLLCPLIFLCKKTYLHLCLGIRPADATAEELFVSWPGKPLSPGSMSNLITGEFVKAGYDLQTKE